MRARVFPLTSDPSGSHFISDTNAGAWAGPASEEFEPGRERRYFEFLYAEICVAIHRRIPRYELWLLVAETAGDPDRLSRDEVQRFIDDELDRLLSREGHSLAPRARQRPPPAAERNAEILTRAQEERPMRAEDRVSRRLGVRDVRSLQPVEPEVPAWVARTGANAR